MVLLESKALPMGSPIIDFKLPACDGETYSLLDFEDAEVIVVIFMCNHCPYVQAVWDRLVALQDRFKALGVQFVGINPNNNPKYEEETLEKMGEYYKEYKMNFPYLMDESQGVARAYDAQCTPDIYVYDQSRKLAYHGRIDDNWQDEGAVTKQELAAALEAILKEEAPSAEQKPAMGCSIKWVE